MRKKLTMLLASLFLVIGTAWAQQQMALNSMPSQVLTSLEDVSADKYFVMQTADEFGMNLWLKDNGGDNHQMKVDNQLTPQVASSSNYLWKITKSGDNYQVQNVGTGRYFPTFEKSANPSTVESANAGSFILVDRNTDGEGKWNFKNSSNAVCLNVSGWWGYTSANPVGWDSEGGNSNYKIFVADVVDLSALVTVPFGYYVGNEYVAYREATFVANSSITLDDVPTLTYYQNYTFKEPGNKVAQDWVGINISCETNFPFVPESGKKYALKSEAGTYFSFNAPTDGTSSAASFSDTPTYFYITVSNKGYIFVDCENAERYIGMNGGWNVGTGSAEWYISTADANGYVTVCRTTEDGNLGHDSKWTAGGGIFTNVGGSCNKWKLEVENSSSDADKYANSIPQFTDETSVIRSNDQYLKVLALDKENIFTGGTAPASVDDMYVLISTKNIRLTRGSHTFTTTFPNNKTSHILSANLWLDKDGDGTFETHLGTTGASGSNSNDLSTVSFIIPQDTELGATRIRFRLDSSWGIAQSADAAANRMIYDIPVTIIEGGDVEEPEVPEVFNPEAGKAYALKVKDQDLYLNVRTLGIDDPSTAGSNNISLSARPFAAIYFEAGGTEGTWKMKNVNGKYVGVPGKGWNPMICDTSHDWTIVMENGVVTIAKSSGAYINANDGAVAAGNPLYCDKKTPLQFELFNFDDVDFITGTGTRNGDNGVGGTGTIQVKEINDEGLDKMSVGMGWQLEMEVENPNGATYNKWGTPILVIGENTSTNTFQLYLRSTTNPTDPNRLDMVLSGSDNYINNVTASGDFSVAMKYDGRKLKITTVNKEGNSATTTLGASLPEITKFAYALPEGMNIKRLSIEKLDPEYTFNVGTTPENATITVTYNKEVVEAGAVFVESELNVDLFTATEVQGYTWEIVVDKAANTLTLNYTEAAAAVENPASVVALINRIGGAGTADKFKFVLDPSINSKQETFVLGAEDGKILIKGTTISAITTGIGWYLNNVAKINIAWNSLNEKTVAVKEEGAAYANLSKLPLPAETETHCSDAKYRYYLNYCTFGYSMTSWTWTRWQQEIDWMALHGINMPLQIVGLEEVWRKFLTLEENGTRKYNYSDSEAKEFVAGPAFTAWWGMNNLEGWGGTGTDGWGGVQDDAWYKRQQALATQILTLQRDLGMQPVLPGFSGMVPTNFTTKTQIPTDDNGGNWGGFHRPHIIDPTYSGFADIAKDYYDCLEAVMGVSQYYSMDPFHEGGSISSGKYTEAYKAIYDAMEAAKSGSLWVIQQWQWDGNQKKSIGAVPEGKLIVLDLFSDGKPAFDSYSGYAPQDAVFCAIPNFGGRSGLMGRLQNVTDNYFSYKTKYKSIKGIGTAPEAIEQTPVSYDLIYQLPWMNGVKPDVAKWVENYAVARYGKDNAVVKEAWSLLRQGPLNYGADGIQGPVEDVWAARPNLEAYAASTWGSTLSRGYQIPAPENTYNAERRQMLIDATYKLLSQRDILDLKEGSIQKSNYNYDIVEFGGAVIADYAHYLLLGIKEAKNAAGNTALYEARRDAFLALILDMDGFRGTNLNFRLGKWTQEARDAAAEVTGAQTATADWYEFNNARTLITTWGDQSQNSGLKDYSYRSWQGLLADYYYPRWKYYFDHNCTNPSSGYFFFEWNWAHGMTHQVGDASKSTTRLAAGAKGYSYSREPEGNTVESARAMLRKYIIPIHMNDGTTYYAYRTFTYDLTDKVTINVVAGSTVDFTQYFNVPADATITGDFINSSEAVSITAVPVKDEEAVYTGSITLADGTKLQNFTVHTPSFNGVYRIKYHQDRYTPSVFIQYNEDENVTGYKLLAEFNGKEPNGELDKWFTIVPSGSGYTISAQGKYLKAPTVWEYMLFSENKEEAGSYLFDDSETHGLYKIVAADGSVLQAWGPTFANAPAGAASAVFSLEQVESYSVTMSSEGYAPVYLPFNVILPEEVEAYDVCGNELVNNSDTYAEGALEKIAEPGDILKAGTPTILKGAPGSTCSFLITTSNKNAKGGLPYSVLRGSYEKKTLKHTEGVKKFILHGTHFDDLYKYVNKERGEGEDKIEEDKAIVVMAPNTCWLEADIEVEQIGLNEGSFVKIEDWLIMYDDKPKGIVLSDIAVKGSSELVIPSTYTINGVEKEIIAISEDFLTDNADITSITIPATLSNLGASKLTFLEEVTYYGTAEPGQGQVGQFWDERLDIEVNGASTWRMTVGVKIDNQASDFNEYGSAILATKDETLVDWYADGSMQLYLKNGHDSIIFKLDNADDRYTYCCLNDDGTTLVNDTFTFVLDNDGSGGYSAKVIFANGKTQSYAISASTEAELNPFKHIYSSMPKGFTVNVKFEEKVNIGLFVGCTNLQNIHVEEDSESFTSKDGILYNKEGNFVIRIPEGRKVVELDKTVVRLNPGSLHGVDADITFHSNPQILFVDDHEEHMVARYYLSLEDAGAVDFVSANANTFLTAKYKRAPLAKGKYGTICLPFVPKNAMKKYDFFELVDASATSLSFSQVDEFKVKTAYLYKLKDNPEEITMENGLDVFETDEDFTVVEHDKYNPNDEKPGEFRALGAYVNNYIETEKYPNSNYYTFSVSNQEFNRITKKLNYRPYRSLFVVTPKEPSQAALAPAKLSLRLVDGSTTEIDASQVDGFAEPEYYDLMGRRVMNPTNGVYIVNGQKVVVE